ncbi:MAG: CDP-alcohol phosphatidyltransferase family protein [Actinomycetota bacterium]|nr:CDP-alcohol phosphatidyltransferase family protein [Actinomycetota bacterium]
MISGDTGDHAGSLRSRDAKASDTHPECDPEAPAKRAIRAPLGVWTVPNALSAARLGSCGIFVWILFFAHEQIAASILLAVLGATDWVDGWIARRFGQVSEVGKVLDPFADRVLLATAVVSILAYGAAPLWLGVVALVREVLVSLAVILLASIGAKRIDVLWVGKAGTFALMSAFPAFLLGDGPAPWQQDMRVFAWVVALLGLALAWVALAEYVPKARVALAEGRRGR